MPDTNRTPPRIFTLICLTGVATLSLNMFVPSLVNIAASFGESYALISLSIAGYMAVTALLQVVLGPLSDRYGRRPVLIWSLAAFTVASVGCLFAPNVWVFLAFRMMQGAIIAGSALSRVVVRDMLPPAEAASRLGYIALAMAIAPMVGPMVGGILDEVFGWRSSFAAFALIGLALWALTWADLGETNTAQQSTFGTQFRAYPELLRSPVFWGYTVCMACSTGAFFVFVAGVPLVATAQFDMSPGRLGFYMGTITAGFVLGSFLAARVGKTYKLNNVMLAGRIVACLGLTGGLLIFALGFRTEAALFGSTIFVGIGNGITMPSASVGAMSVRADLAGSASGLAGAVNVGAGALLTFATGILLSVEASSVILLGIMLAVSVTGLLSALFVMRRDDRC